MTYAPRLLLSIIFRLERGLVWLRVLLLRYLRGGMRIRPAVEGTYTPKFMQLKRLERIVHIDGVLQYYWRHSDTPTLITPKVLVIKTKLRACLDKDRRCNVQECIWHATYVLYWGRVSIQESLDMVNPRWSVN